MIGFSNGRIEAIGELAARITQNAARLSAPCYRPEAIYTADQSGWPGDWEGRTILALVSLWNALGSKPPYIDLIMENFPENLNEAGYLGPVAKPGELIDEQQLSGHNWLVRGLIEYYLLTSDESIRGMILKIVSNLYIPLKGAYHGYPLGKAARSSEGGGYAGVISGASGRWKTSTDVGCAFMCLDALSQVYEVFRLSEVKELLEEMIGVFERIDFVGGNMQTHASLSAVRGILRFAEALGIDGESGESSNNTAGAKGRKYLDIAARIFDLYLRTGMTENYANYNWFGRIDTWTEPCAIVDSEMVALTLFRLKKDVNYLTLANRIRFNALGYAQRPGGGFGTDKCLGLPEDPSACGINPGTGCNTFLSPSGSGISEAYWCCTMRGSEGLWSMLRHSVLTERGVSGGPDTVWLPFTTDLNADLGNMRIKIRSGLPYEGNYSVSVTACSKPVSAVLMIYTPDRIDRREISAAPGETVTVNGSVSLDINKVRSSDGKHFKLLRGDLLLGEKNGEGSSAPLTDMFDLTLEEAGRDKRKVLV